MKFLFGLCAVLVCAAYVQSESCTVNGDCQATGCSTNYHVICEHQAGAGATTNGGLCTCAVNDSSCNAKEDCASTDCPPNLNYHCYDGQCICSRW